MAATDRITFEITRYCGVIEESTGRDGKPTGWRRELNLVSWNGGEPKYDIREWNEDHTRMSKGITLSYGQAAKVAELLAANI